MWHSKSTGGSLAPVITAGAISAGAAVLLPSALLLPLLVAGLALALVASRRGAEPLNRQDVSAIVEALHNIGQGEFNHAQPLVQTPAGERIGSAVRELAQQFGARVEQLQSAAQHDPLTGLANRAHFERTVERRLEQRTPDLLCCLMFVDIDGFKEVNDTLGHNLGDRLLQGISERLGLATRLDERVENDRCKPEDERVRIARFGGDEFVIFMDGLATQTPARKIAHRIVRVMAEPFELGAHVAGVTASVGLAFVPSDAATYADLLRAADAAMYHAKRSGGNRVEQFSVQLDRELQRHVALERDLRDALARGEFELHYQPQYDCRSLKISSAEALIRWRHPQRGLVGPAEFIPLAEKSNLICDIGEWVMREAISTIARLERRGLPLRISVNVSPQQLEQLEFVSMVKAALARPQATPRLLEVEVTESLAMRDGAMAAERLGRLADLGVSVAIDDFGTGYANLASLIRLPLSRLKIDRSLLSDLTGRAEVRTLVQTIISMANGLGLHSVAEGVEDAEQLGLLSDMGCDAVQGFYLARPLDEQAFERLLVEANERDTLRSQHPPMLAAVACR